MFTLLDLLFPRQCLGCRTEGAWLCSACYSSPHQTFGCPECLPAGSGGRYCPKHPSQLTGLLWLDLYTSQLIREAIHRLKYNGLANIAEELGTHLKRLVTAQFDGQPFSLVPVPLHPVRLRERGYNQSLLVARAIDRGRCLPVLERLRATPSQTRLTALERQRNVVDAFCLKSEATAEIKNQRLIIVDDVVTTGSTLKAIASLLWSASPVEVWGLVIANDQLDSNWRGGREPPADRQRA